MTCFVDTSALLAVMDKDDAIDWISSVQHIHGMAALLAADRRNLSLVDCVSFDAMRQRGLRQVFAFDKHFEEPGFTTELGSTGGP